MRKLKNGLILLLAVAVIACGGALPMAVSALWDRATGNQIQYGEMAAVTLSLGLHQSNLPLLGKLSLLYCTAVQIDQSQASMTEEQVMEAVKADLAPYQDAGLICCDLDSLSFECAADYDYDVLNPERHCVFWRVNISGSVDGQKHTGFLILDDETGKILTIDYNHRANNDFGYEVEYHPENLEPFCSIYFDSWDNSIFSWESLNIARAEDSEYSRVYRWGDEVYGQINMEFILYCSGDDSAGGFYNYIY